MRIARVLSEILPKTFWSLFFRTHCTYYFLHRIVVGNNQGIFQLLRFTRNENITKKFLGGTFFDSHCINRRIPYHNIKPWGKKNRIGFCGDLNLVSVPGFFAISDIVEVPQTLVIYSIQYHMLWQYVTAYVPVNVVHQS